MKEEMEANYSDCCEIDVLDQCNRPLTKMSSTSQLRAVILTNKANDKSEFG